MASASYAPLMSWLRQRLGASMGECQNNEWGHVKTGAFHQEHKPYLYFTGVGAYMNILPVIWVQGILI